MLLTISLAILCVLHAGNAMQSLSQGKSRQRVDSLARTRLSSALRLLQAYAL